MEINYNSKLAGELAQIELMMETCEALYKSLTQKGFIDEANQIDAVGQSLNLHHYDLVEKHGPIVQRKGK